MAQENLSKIIEDLTSILGQTGVSEDVLQDEAPEAEVVDVATEEQPTPEVVEPVEEVPFNDTMSLADKFDAKAKIARALDNLKASIEEFKDATSEKVDLIRDAELIQSIEGLDAASQAIEAALAQGELMNSELNNVFTAEQPAEVTDDIVVDELETEAETKEDEEVVEPEPNFDELAGLQLIKDEN